MRSILAFVLVLVLATTGYGQLFFYGSKTVKEGDLEDVIYDGGDLTNKATYAVSGSVLKLVAGTFTLTDTIASASGDTLYIVGEGYRWTKITSSMSLFEGSGSYIFLKNVTLECTGTDNAFSSGRFILDDCLIRTRFADFSDSVWISDCVIEQSSGNMDSIRFGGYCKITNTEQVGTGWTFGISAGDTAIVDINGCYGSVATQNLHFPNAEGKASGSIKNCQFSSTASSGYSVGISGYSILKFIGNSFENYGTSAGSATFYAHNTNTADSTLAPNLKVMENSFYNWATTGTQYSAYIQTFDTLWIAQNSGNKALVIDSSDVSGIPTPPNYPIVYWTDGNYFSTASFNFGANGIKNFVVGPGGSSKNIKTSGITYYMNMSKGTNVQTPFLISDNVNGGTPKTRFWIDYNGKITLNGSDLYLKDAAALTSNASGSEADVIFNDNSMVKAGLDSLKVRSYYVGP